MAPYIYSALVDDGRLKYVGGAEVQQGLIARLLARDGFRVSVLTLDFGQPDGQVVDGVEIHKMPQVGKRGLRGLRWFTPRLTDVITRLSDLKPDIVYSRSISAYTAPISIYARRHQARSIYAGASDRDFASVRAPSTSRRDWALFRWGLKRTSTVLVQNRQQAGDARLNHGIEATLCPNFFAETGILGGSVNGPVIWVGTMGRGKRPELFLEIARRLPQLQFAMVGGALLSDGGQEAYNRVQQAAKLLPNLVFHGYVQPQDVGKVFDGASALVNTSLSEGFPNTFLQSWIRGVPTVSFVNPELATGESGTLACASFDEMVDAVRGVVSSPAAWEGRSAQVRALFAKYHSEAAALQRYRKILLPNFAAE